MVEKVLRARARRGGVYRPPLVTGEWRPSVVLEHVDGPPPGELRFGFERWVANFHVVYPSRKLVPAKVRAFVDELAAEVRLRMLTWDRNVFGSVERRRVGGGGLQGA